MEHKNRVGFRAAPGVSPCSFQSQTAGQNWQGGSYESPCTARLRIGPKASRKPEAKPGTAPYSLSSAPSPFLGGSGHLSHLRKAGLYPI